MPVHSQQDPDTAVVALFRTTAMKNEAETAKQGRPIFDDLEICELRYPGSKNVGVYPATSFSHWADDPETGEQVRVTYAERFKRQYQQFKSHDAQTKSGTPLAYAPFLTESRRAELRAQNIYTVEALAHIDGAELKNLGHGGRELKNSAQEYIEQSKTRSTDTKLMQELEQLKARNTLLEEDMKLLKDRNIPPEDEYDRMGLEQLREYIATHSGQAPLGTLNRKSLARLARDLKVERVA